MRWTWIDAILEFKPGERCVAIKNISAAEEVVHDHFPATPTRRALPVLPHTLIIEGMAQTAGILVGHVGGFKEKVILAKIAKATFDPDVLPSPGTTLRYTAELDRVDAAGAATVGTVERLRPGRDEGWRAMGEVELIFSHVDQNRSGVEFPEHNFVFGPQFYDLLHRAGIAIEPDVQEPRTK